MTSLAIPTSPNSFHLRRFGNNSLRFPSALVGIRFRGAANRSVIRSSAAGAPDARDDRSWNGSKVSSADFFAGWSDGGGGGSDRDSQKDGSFGGIFGAGMAGVFFFAGVTFAALSLSKKNTRGLKPQMEPLTAKQEIFLSSDCHNTEVQNGDMPKSVFSMAVERNSDQIFDRETDINEDPLRPMEIPEGTNESLVKQAISLAGEVSDSTAELVQFANDNKFSGSYNTSSCLLDQVVENIKSENGFSSKESSRTDSRDNNPDHQQENDNLSESAGHKYSFGVPNGSDFELPNVPLAEDILTIESSDKVEFLAGFESIEKSAEDSKKVDIIDDGGTTWASDDASASFSVTYDAKENLPFKEISGLDFCPDEDSVFWNESTAFPKGQVLDQSLQSCENVSDDTRGNIETQYNRRSISEVFGESFSSWKPAPSLLSEDLQIFPGKVLVPAVVDQVQWQAFKALQVMKVIELDVKPGDLCTRREYARWLVSSSGITCRNPAVKVYPAMYIENITELAFEDITPEDPDFSCIQGLAEAGLISSKLSLSDMNSSTNSQQGPAYFYPECPLSRQDLVSWKMALEKRQFPEVDRNYLYQRSGYIDVDKINPDAWPALVADLCAGEHGIIALAFGYTRLFQPNKPVTNGQAAVALATGDATEALSEELARVEADSLAESAVNAHSLFEAQVEMDIHTSFKEELAVERQKIDALETLADEARLELEKLRSEREDENIALIKGRAAAESEIEMLSRLRNEVEEQLQGLMNNKMELAFERDRIKKIREDTESENQAIIQLQYELEVERKALSMARSWALEEAKRARDQARALEAARDRWEKQGIKVVVDKDIQGDASYGLTWLAAGDHSSTSGSISRALGLVDKLKALASEIRIKNSAVVEKIIQKIVSIIYVLRKLASDASNIAKERGIAMVSNARVLVEELGEAASGFSSRVGGSARRAADGLRESVDKITKA